MDARGRGRARGRARSGPQQGQGPRPGPAPRGGPAPPAQAPGPQGAWGRPPHPQQVPPPQQPPAPSGWVRPQMQAAPVPSTVGRGSRQGAGGDADAMIDDPQRALQGLGDGAGAQERGRGAGNGGVRGRTNRFEIIHTRPQNVQSKMGQSGQQIKLIANYFTLIEAGKWGLNQYRVDFNPEIDNTRQRKGLIRTGMANVVNGYLFDGTVLYTPQLINPDPLEVFVQTENGENIRITIRLVGDVAWGDYHYLQLFNIIIRKCLAFMQLQMVGRNYYDPNARIAVPEHRLELWPGYYTSMRQHERNILMNCDVQFKVMRMDNVYDMLLECRGSNVRNEFQSKVIGSIVLTYYNNKTYKVDDVDFNSTPTSTFPMKDGTQMSFIQYYRQKYNININVENQPMLVSRSKAREIRAGMPETILLVPELCQLTGLTDRQRENFQLMRALADHTRVGPQQRMQKLMEFSQRMRRNNAKYSAGQQADWTKELRALPMFVPGLMQKFAIVCPVKFRGPCQEFVQCLQRSARGMSWDIGQPRIFDIPDDRSHTYLEQIENIISKNNPNMIMCVVPNNSQDRYSAIKKKAVWTVGFLHKLYWPKIYLRKVCVMSIATKVAIQLNCKIGGAPWTVVMPLSNLMVVGYDVCRDTANKGKSFGAMVASLDKQITRYYSYTSEHRLEEELSDNFAAFLLLACHRFKEQNGRFPERILIYRDGVGDGQLPYVHQHEVANIKKKLSDEIYKNNDLKMAFVVVSKRINTRIFTDRGNPPPGTVIRLFIVSQCVRQGTVAPTSYNVIEDTMGLPPDRMQMLTYKLCHMYYNWSGTVRVPAPCQYAHKLAFLVAQSLHRPAHRALETLLYYL
ncbi:hypothetical protein NQ314_013586 [Rhamnusium bicolor]|uniref:Piwi n=1 Tax=Rhamnusium bicolor TaxID=1586634 RepID=A0AAV8X6I5_9CUCU|nr:hypothetical protein NQ314_013586 [Rhamnusium bicolor]